MENVKKLKESRVKAGWWVGAVKQSGDRTTKWSRRGDEGGVEEGGRDR